MISRRQLLVQMSTLVAVNAADGRPKALAQSTAIGDAADVRAAEAAFNAAQNAGNIEAMFQMSLPDRTVYGSAGGALVEGWTEESKGRRQAQFDAGRKIDLSIEDLI